MSELGPVLVFGVLGEPIPQGSMKAFARKGGGRPIVTSDNPRLKVWRRAITAAARVEIPLGLRSEAVDAEGLPIFGTVFAIGIPVAVVLHFQFERPKSSKRRYPSGRPDADKLARAVLDALTDARVWDDDGQVVALSIFKGYGERAGVKIQISEIRD